MAPRSLTAGAVLALALTCPAAPLQAAQIEGVTFPERFETASEPLTLSGVGLLRYRVLIKGYVAALYLPEGTPPEQALEPLPRRLEIEYFWSIPASAFRDITVRGIEQVGGRYAAERFRPEIARLNALYENVRPGDRYALTYLPGRGTELALNGEALGRVGGDEFATALFSIWLGEDSLDESLREQLLTVR